MISEAQAKIFRKLYVQTKNQDHVQKWTREHLTHAQASPIIARIIKLTYAMLNQPDVYMEIQTWGREEVKKLGYEEPQFNKSV